MHRSCGMARIPPVGTVAARCVAKHPVTLSSIGVMIEPMGQNGDSPAEHLDVLIVGAGLSGIGAACRLRRECPDKSFAILEARDSIGGTWDLFRYPGIRSDSDMFTLGYSFRPWQEAK